MNIVSAHLSPTWTILLWLGAAALYLLMLRRAAWHKLTESGNLNALLGASVALLGLWLIKTGIKPGLDFHLLGATALTLMFRPWFALLGLSLVVLATTALNGEWAAFPGNLLILGLLPVSVSWAIYRFVDRRLSNHLFIYLFVNAFFGAALTIGAVGLAATAFAALAGAYGLDYLLEEFLPFFMLMAWAEAFATGMIMTILVVYRPQWVATFDDQRYLVGK
jgi:uncharacterized membrane protein